MRGCRLRQTRSSGLMRGCRLMDFRSRFSLKILWEETEAIESRHKSPDDQHKWRHMTKTSDVTDKIRWNFHNFLSI